MNELASNMTRRSTVVIISYYAKRPIDSLLNLLGNLAQAQEQDRCPVVVVVNRVDTKQMQLNYPDLDLKVLYRDNVGMNIGAWDYGWRQSKGFSHAIFLQDDCYPVRAGWLIAIEEKLANPATGLIGESANRSWELGWSELRKREAGVFLPEHNCESGQSNRVDFYLSKFNSWGIQSNQSGSHLRALCWAARIETLEKINGFPIGADYGECIAAEIATSKKVEQFNLKVCQIAKQPFYYFKHNEWNQSYPGGEYSKLGARDKELKKLQDENERFREQLGRVEALSDSSKWRQLLMILSGRFSVQLKRLTNKTE